MKKRLVYLGAFVLFQNYSIAAIISTVEPFMSTSVNAINRVTDSQLDIDKNIIENINSSIVSNLKKNQEERNNLIKENEQHYKLSDIAYKQLLFKLKQTNNLEYLNGK